MDHEAMSDQAEVITIRGEEITVSLLVARRFRDYMPGYVERVFDVNPGLAAMGPFLAVGTKVLLPAPTIQETQGKVIVLKLWD
jgi:phage tail protein X